MKLQITLLLAVLGFVLVAAQTKCFKNQVPGCGQNCGKTCEDYNRPKFSPKPVCPRCSGGGCECDTANDYWWNSTIKRCIHGPLCLNYGR